MTRGDLPMLSLAGTIARQVNVTKVLLGCCCFPPSMKLVARHNDAVVAFYQDDKMFLIHGPDIAVCGTSPC